MGLITELRRRNVFRVAVAYIIGAWLLLQATEVLSSLLELPPVVGKVVVLVLAIGLLPAIILAWVYELTPDGLKRDSEVDRSQSIAGRTGRRLNLLIIAMLMVVAAYFFWESRFKPATTGDGQAVKATEFPFEQPPAKPGAVADKSIAVLPFVNMSAEVENEYFADGLSEEILNRLAQVSQLRVIGRTSSFAFKGENQDLREIGRTLGADHILEGSVRRQGDKVRVTAQLIASGDGAHLWSNTYDRQMDDVFLIQDEIAQRVVDALDIVLDEGARAAMSAAGVRDVDAFVAYQQGIRALLDAHGEAEMYEMLADANRYFDQALAAAPDFSDASLQKADYYAHLVMDSDRSLAEREEALATHQRLLDAAHAAARDPQRKRVIDLDRILFTDDWSRLPGILKGIFAGQGCAASNWIEAIMPFHYGEELAAYFERQLLCDPLMLLTYAQLGLLSARAGDFEQAWAYIERGRELGGEHRWLRVFSRELRMMQGQAEQQLNALDAGSSGALSQEQWRFKVDLLAALGRLDEARALLESAPADWRSSNRSRIAFAAILGDRAGANAAAAELDVQPGGSLELIRTINTCGCGAPFDLEATPRFRARLNEAGFAWPPVTNFHYPAKDW